MKNSLFKFALVASLILNLTVVATAGYHYYRQSRLWVSPYGKVMEKNHFLFEELSLKPEQLAAMKSKAISFHTEIDRRRQEIDAKRKELVALMRFEKPDRKVIGATIKEISNLQEDMQRKIAGHVLEIKVSLDKDQQQKFLDLIERAMVEERATGCVPK